MNADESKYRLEILKMARELLNEEYINKRAEDHNKWLAECDVAWKTRGIKLPYPPFAPYPSEAEILAKAASLYNFVVEKPQADKPTVANPLIDLASAPSPWVTYLNPQPVEAPPPIPAPDATVLTPTQPTAPVTTVVETPPMPDVVEDKKDTEPNTTEQQLASDLANKSKPLFAPGAAVKSLLPTWLQSKDNNV